MKRQLKTFWNLWVHVMTNKPELLIATRNVGKAEELKNLLDIPLLDIRYMSEFPEIPDVEEIYHTYSANAILKAKYAAEQTGMPSIADDSGFQIYGLNNFPGVYSARCAGENATDDEKVEFVLQKAKDLTDRRALFVCVMCYYNPTTEHIATFNGVCYGKLLKSPVGVSKKNLQYDRIFRSDECLKVFSEISEEEKALVSHRGKAARKAKEHLERYLVQGN